MILSVQEISWKN